MPRRQDDEDGFASFVAGAAPRLGRTARLLTTDRHLAEDLVQSTLLAVYLRWHRIRAMEAPHAYAHRVLYTTFCSWRGRRWSVERPTADLPDRPSPDGDPAEGAVTAPSRRLWPGCRAGSAPSSSHASTTTSPSSRPPTCSAARPER